MNLLKESHHLLKVENYFKNHPSFNSFVHLTTGIGIGILLTGPYFMPHPLRWGFFFLGLGILGHLYPLFKK